MGRLLTDCRRLCGADNALVSLVPYERASRALHSMAIHKYKYATQTEMGGTGPGNLGGIMQAREVTNPWAHREVAKSVDKITFDPKPSNRKGGTSPLHILAACKGIFLAFIVKRKLKNARQANVRRRS
jgi:hypothetical protein